MANVRPLVRPQIQPTPASPAEPPAPRMTKYENSGVLYDQTSTHPKAPFLKGVATIGGVKYTIKIWRNRGKGKNGEDVITLVAEAKDDE